MANLKELRKVCRVVYRIKIGCVSAFLENQTQPPSAGDELLVSMVKEALLQTNMAHLLSPQTVNGVSIISENIASWIHNDNELRDKLQIHYFSEPLVAHLKYLIEDIDKDAKNIDPRTEVNTVLLYDGLLAIFGIRSDIRFNSQRHGAHLNSWLKDVLTKHGIDVQFSVINPPGFAVEILLLDSAPQGENIEDYRDDMALKYQYTSGSTMRFSYVCSPEESEDEAILSALIELYLGVEPFIKHYFVTRRLSRRIDRENDQIRDKLNMAGKEFLKYHDLHLLKFYRRLQKCQTMARILAMIYTLMPDLDTTTTCYKKQKELFVEEGENYAGGAVVKLLGERLPERVDVILTGNERAMLQHEVSEIKSQINSQFLLLSAIIALVSIIITAIVSLLR